MKQHLRSLWTLLLLMMWCSVGFAQTTVTFDATKDKSASTTLTKDGVTLKIGKGTLDNGKEYRWFGEDPKTLTISSTETITKIEFTCTANNTSSNGPGKISKASTGKYTYSRKIGTWTGETNSVVFSNTTQVRMTKVVVTLAATKTLTSLAISGEPTKKAYNDGEAFDPTGLVVTGTYDDASTATITNGITWTKTPATLSVGATSCSVTATVNGVTSPAYNVTGLTVTKTITLSIDPATSTVVKAPVKVTLKADAGATIYYTTNGEEPTTTSTKYDAPFEVTKSGTTVKALAVAEGAVEAKAEATYTIKPDQPVFSDGSKDFNDAFDVTLTLPESTDANSTIHYAIGKKATADSPLYEAPINISAENDGDKVILHAVVVDQYGNVGMEKYCTYTKTTSFIFDFASDWEGITPGTIINDKNAANVVAGKELKVGGIVMTATNGIYQTTCLVKASGKVTLNVYKGCTITFTAPEGYNIAEITFNGTNINTLIANKETYTGDTWTGNAHAVEFGNDGSQIKINTATIKLVAAPATSLTLDENADDTDTKIKENNDKTVDVTLTRSLKAGVWNTICLPFDVTAEQIKNILKAEGMVREYADDDATAQTITFKKVEGNMKAGEPYLIKPTEDITSLVFEGVTITAIEGNLQGKAYGIWGTLGKHTMETDGTELFLNAAGKFVAPAAATNTMKGFRAYFMVPKGSSAAALNINIDGETTGINSIETNATVNGKVYNLNGQYVGNSLNGLKKGIYVVNGKKVIK